MLGLAGIFDNASNDAVSSGSCEGKTLYSRMTPKTLVTERMRIGDTTGGASWLVCVDGLGSGIETGFGRGAAGWGSCSRTFQVALFLRMPRPVGAGGGGVEGGETRSGGTSGG